MSWDFLRVLRLVWQRWNRYYIVYKGRGQNDSRVSFRGQSSLMIVRLIVRGMCWSSDILSLVSQFPFNQANNELPVSTVWFLHIQTQSGVKTSVAQTGSHMQHKAKKQACWLTTRQTWQPLCTAVSLLTAELSASSPGLLLSSVFLKVCVIMDVLTGRSVVGGAVFGSGWNAAIHSASRSFLASPLRIENIIAEWKPL